MGTAVAWGAVLGVSVGGTIGAAVGENGDGEGGVAVGGAGVGLWLGEIVAEEGFRVGCIEGS